MSSRWNHKICEACWIQERGTWEPFGFDDDGQELSKLVSVITPVRVVDPDAPPTVELCCYCGSLTIMGIYVRHDPEDDVLVCKGEHE